MRGNVERVCSAASCSYIISVPEHIACSLLYLYAVMVMERAAWSSLIPQLCLAPHTWDHLLSPLPWLTLCSFSFFHSSSTTLLCQMQQMFRSCPTWTVMNRLPSSHFLQTKGTDQFIFVTSESLRWLVQLYLILSC